MLRPTICDRTTRCGSSIGRGSDHPRYRRRPRRRGTEDGRQPSNPKLSEHASLYADHLNGDYPNRGVAFTEIDNVPEEHIPDVVVKSRPEEQPDYWSWDGRRDQHEQHRGKIADRGLLGSQGTAGYWWFRTPTSTPPTSTSLNSSSAKKSMESATSRRRLASSTCYKPIAIKSCHGPALSHISPWGNAPVVGQRGQHDPQSASSLGRSAVGDSCRGATRLNRSVVSKGRCRGETTRAATLETEFESMLLVAEIIF